MKTLTEIVKHIKTSGKNLIVYSSMLLALTGAYACGGNDNSGSDGGFNLQDTGNGGSSASLDCDKLTNTLERCDYINSVDGKVMGKCENIQMITQPSYQDALNKCAEKGACGVFADCIDSAIASCTPADNFSTFNDKWKEKYFNCGGERKNFSDNGKCYNPQAIDDSLSCLEKFTEVCSDEDIKENDMCPYYCHQGMYDCSPGGIMPAGKQWDE